MSLEANIPSTPIRRRLDDVLTYTCKTSDGLKAYGSIASLLNPQNSQQVRYFFTRELQMPLQISTDLILRILSFQYHVKSE